MEDLHVLPKFRDGWSFLYAEHCRVEREDKAVAIIDARGKVPVPCANVAFLMLGPGTDVTQAALTALAENGCLVYWCGEEGVRMYAYGEGKTRSAANLLRQARLWANPRAHLDVVMRLYRMRFAEDLPSSLTLQEIRGKEGVRVRETYARASRETGVAWSGRSYKRQSWNEADPVNRALSTANACLYGVCHAGVLALGFSPALGFVHTGKMLSFVYDVADLYKTNVSIPVAFREAATAEDGLETRVRRACRDIFRETRILKRIVEDLIHVFDFRAACEEESGFDADRAQPGDLWDFEERTVPGGRNFAEEGGGGEGEGDGGDGP